MRSCTFSGHHNPLEWTECQFTNKESVGILTYKVIWKQVPPLGKSALKLETYHFPTQSGKSNIHGVSQSADEGF